MLALSKSIFCFALSTLICGLIGVGVGHAGTYYGASNSSDTWTSYRDSERTTPTGSDPTRVGGSLTFSALASGGPGLSITGGGEAFFQNGGSGTATNTINGEMTFTGDSSAHFNNDGDGTTTNNISGGISLTGGQIDFYNSSTGSITNTITGVITLNGGGVYFHNSGDNTAGPTSAVTNTIAGGITLTSGRADFYNGTLGTVTNNITGGITLNGGNARFYNQNSGTTTSTIDTVTLSGGTLYLGGGGSRTTIGTLNWAGGDMKLIYANGSFGNTHINNLNVTGAVNLLLTDGDDNTLNDLTALSGSHTLFTFDTFTGDPSNITLTNPSALVEVTGAPGTSGITLNGSKATINLAPTASANNPADIETIQSPTDIPATIVSNVIAIADLFAPTPYQKAEAGARIQKALQQRKGGDSFENLLTALSEGGDANKFVKIAGDYRVFAAPYATYTRNNGHAINGSSSKYYGMVMGMTHLVKSIDTNFFFTGVVGASKTQMNRSVNSYITGKNTTLGISARKTFIKYLDVDSGLNLTAVRNEQWRQGNPTPNTSYIAKSKFNTYAAAWRNETGYIFKLPNKQSLKPNIGLQLNKTKQTAINERDAGIYAQSYKSKTGMNGELYGGLGYRKEWKNERFEGKLTGKYEIGRKSGNGKVRTTVYTASTPDGLSSSSTGADLVTHYFSVYGSILDMKTRWKIVPGITASLQRRQKSGTVIVKIERRF